MKCLITFILLLGLSTSWAESFHSRIYQLDLSRQSETPHIVKFENGRVAFLGSRDGSLLKALKESVKRGDLLELELDEDYDLVSAATIHGVDEFSPADYHPRQTPEKSYEPTVLPSLSAAKRVFSKMRRGWQDDSQCYNRAHIWAFEEFRFSGLQSMKLFLFFTNRYIRNYRYKWWFHVSPMTLVKENGSIHRRVLDKRYTSGPRYVKTWTNLFVHSKRSCPVVSKYSQYRNNQETEDCYLIPVNQYYWQPRDIDRFERSGYEKNAFIQSEIDWSYWEAF